MKFESQLRIEGPEVTIYLGNLQARGAGGSLQALDVPARCTGHVHYLVQEVPIGGEGGQVRMRARRRAGQGLLRDDPTAGAKEASDLAEGPRRVGLLHQGSSA